MIDFSKIAALIPEEGRLVLTFSRKAANENGDAGTKELAIVFALCCAQHRANYGKEETMLRCTCIIAIGLPMKLYLLHIRYMLFSMRQCQKKAIERSRSAVPPSNAERFSFDDSQGLQPCEQIS